MNTTYQELRRVLEICFVLVPCVNKSSILNKNKTNTAHDISLSCIEYIDKYLRKKCVDQEYFLCNIYNSKELSPIKIKSFAASIQYKFLLIYFENAKQRVAICSLNLKRYFVNVNNGIILIISYSNFTME